MALGPTDLVLGYMSMTQFTPPWTFKGASWQDRCAAAAAGGFAGIGIVPSVYDEARAAGHSDADLRRALEAGDLVLAEIEAPAAIPAPSERETFARELDHVLEIASLFGTERILLVGGPGVSPEDLAGTFAWACDRCAEQSLLATLEFIDEPSLSAVPDAASALRVVEAAGRENGGVMVDLYHHVNGPNDWGQLEALPGDAVKGIQFDDAAIPRVSESYLDDTLHHRRVPGEGDADVVRFVRTMDAIGASCPYSLEVISDEIVQLAPQELGERLGSATRRIFEAARG